MQADKKIYSTPELAVYGDVETITQQGGGKFMDVPRGTPITSTDAVTGNLS